MKNTDNDKQEQGLTTQRIEALTDGVFAIAMTLLALSLEVPETLQDTPETGVANFMLQNSHLFLNYIMSFVLLSIFWINHHKQFHFIKRTDRKHLWINLFILMFIASIPFSTSLIGDYPNIQITSIVFEMNMFILGMLFYLNWNYATYNRRLVNKNLSQEIINVIKNRAFIVPVVSLSAIALSFISPRWSTLIYFSIPIIMSTKPFQLKT